MSLLCLAVGVSEGLATKQGHSSRLRWYQFRLRTLLLLCLVAAFGCAWFVRTWERAKQQERAVRTLEKAGVLVNYFYTVEDEWGFSEAESVWPEWMHSLLGDDFFFTVREVWLPSQRVAGEVLARLRELPGIYVLRVNDAFCDEDMEIVAALPALKSLDLGGSMVSDSGLKHLEGLHELEYLYILTITDMHNWSDVARITDDGIAHLRGLESLRVLELCGSDVRITARGLEYLEGLPALEKLDLSCTQIEGRDLARLLNFPRLRCLTLHSTEVGDRELEVLGRIQSLQRLGIYDTEITAAGLAHLTAMLQIEALELDADPHLSEEGVAQLEKLPKLRDLTIRTNSADCLARLSRLQNLEKLRLIGGPDIGWANDDLDLSTLSELGQLQSLDISRTQITDNGLIQLATVTTLKELFVPRTCTTAGVVALRKRLPGLESVIQL